VQPVAPGDGATAPTGQRVQPVAPEALEKAPGGQGAHAAPRKLAFAKNPGVQGTQARAGADAAVPGGHSEALRAQNVPLGALNSLAAHAPQLEMEMAASITPALPGGQRRQADAADALTAAE